MRSLVVGSPTINYEVIIVDNDSTDRTTERAFWSRVCFTDKKNIAGVRNVGARNASGDYLIFVDADTIVSAELLHYTVETLLQGTRWGGALLRLDKPSFIGSKIVNLWNKICIRKGWCTGCFMFVERSRFFSVGGFNENLFLLEDIDLCNRLKKHSYGKLITECKVTTSARKLTLYRWHEHLRFWLTLIFRFHKTIISRRNCFMWYDGRR